MGAVVVNLNLHCAMSLPALSLGNFLPGNKKVYQKSLEKSRLILFRR
jgi:hypothetical protein